MEKPSEKEYKGEEKLGRGENVACERSVEWRGEKRWLLEIETTTRS